MYIMLCGRNLHAIRYTSLDYPVDDRWMMGIDVSAFCSQTGMIVEGAFGGGSERRSESAVAGTLANVLILPPKI
jgi:hypothetical protein